MNDKYTLGELVHLTARIEVEGVELDPGTLELVVQDPSGAEVVYPAGTPSAPTLPIVRVSPGVFYADIPADAIGTWAYRWLSTGTGAGASEGSYYVNSLLDSPLNIIITPGDYDGIRLLLGVTKMDVEDFHIDMRPFGPVGEAMSMSEVPDWAEIYTEVTGPTPSGNALIRWQFMVAGTQYAIASIIANTMARGGMVGLVRGEGMRTPDQWAAFATELWQMGQQHLNQAEAMGLDEGEELPVSMLGIGPWHILSGPSRKTSDSPWALRTDW